MGHKEKRPHNTGLAKVAVQCSADTFVVNQSLVLRINICGENRHLRVAANRYASSPPNDNPKPQQCQILADDWQGNPIMQRPVWVWY